MPPLPPKPLLITILILLGSTAHTPHNNTAEASVVYIGALETKPIGWPENARWDGDTAMLRIVRPLFYNKHGVWHSLQEVIGDTSIYPSEQFWHIAFDGKHIGELHSKKEPLRNPNHPWTWSRDAYHSTVEKNLPVIGQPTEAFMGWDGDAAPRPLVVVSENNCLDPQRWRPFEPDTAELPKLVRFYNSYLALLDEFAPVDYTDLEFAHSYTSVKNDQLLQVRLKTTEDNWSGYPIWIYQSHNGYYVNLSYNIDLPFIDDFSDDDYSTNVLVDAGDYDNNGQSELLFWSSRYDGDGYILFSNNCAEMSVFLWRYH